MRIDMHTHLWPPEDTPQVQLDYFESRGIDVKRAMSAEGLLDAMEGICDAAVIATLYVGSNLPNSEMVKCHEHVKLNMEKHPGKFYALCCVDPFGGEESVEYLKRYLDSGSFIGLKLHPNIQAFYPNDPKVFPIYECLQGYGLPVLFHSGGIGITPFIDDYANIAAIEEVACRFPDMPIIMGHAGRGKHFDTASVLRKHKNVYADISANFCKLNGSEHLSLLELIKTVKTWIGNTDKLMFGSDYPFYTAGVTAACLKRIADEEPFPVTKEDIDRIMNVNGWAFLQRYCAGRL